MKIVQGDQLEWVRGLEYCGGTFHFRNLMEGTSGAIDNFQQVTRRQETSGSEISNTLTTPCGRHRHSPTTAGKSSTTPLPKEYFVPACSS